MPAPRPVPPSTITLGKRACPFCGRLIAVERGGALANHRAPRRLTLTCLGSGDKCIKLWK